MAAARKRRNDDIVRNRRATFDYEIGTRYEAGLALVGSEVKSLRLGKVELVDAFVAIERGEAWLRQLRIAPFAMAHAYPPEPLRPRKLLLHRPQIEEIDAAIKRDGETAIPIRLYFKEGKVKVEIALAKGRKKADKRAAIRSREASREAREAIVRAQKERR